MSDKSHKNPYRKGSNYNAGFAFMQSHSSRFTRSQLVEVYQKLGKKGAAGMASATVLLSPREKDGRGDKRGNFSAMGHVYFVTPLKHVKGQEKAFALRWRKMVLARREYKRIETKAVPQEKTHKATTTTTTPAKVTTPVVSEATA